MSEDAFWELIDRSRQFSHEELDRVKWIESELVKHSMEDIVDFAAWLDFLLKKAHDKLLWVAGSIVTGFLSDDGFVYFKCWLISQGKDVYEAALTDPDSLARINSLGRHDARPILDLEELLYIPGSAFAKKAGRPMTQRKEVLPNWSIPSGISKEPLVLKNPEFAMNSQEAIKRFPLLARRFLQAEDGM